jgi:hypothetical protein
MHKVIGYVDALGKGKGPNDTGCRKTRRSIKRQTSKARRRASKRLMEDAPKRVTQGWHD